MWFALYFSWPVEEVYGYLQKLCAGSFEALSPTLTLHGGNSEVQRHHLEFHLVV